MLGMGGLSFIGGVREVTRKGEGSGDDRTLPYAEGSHYNASGDPEYRGAKYIPPDCGRVSIERGGTVATETRDDL